MSKVHIQPTHCVVRWYDEGSYEEKSPYKAIASYIHMSDDTVYIFGMHGNIKKGDIAKLFERLYAMGIRTVLADRRGRLITKDLAKLLNKEAPIA